MKRFYLSLILLSFSICKAQILIESPIPSSSTQMILILTESMNDTKGILHRFEINENDIWEKIDEPVPVVLGKNGLGWGKGLHQSDSLVEPVKKEGDGRSPAGVFRLSSVFGYAPVSEMKDLKMPYTHVTEMIECIDDIYSDHYNQIVNRSKTDNIDWSSSEKMHRFGIWYKLGIVVDHNVSPIIKGAGSCIFLHNWADPDETTAGCTEMSPKNMEEIVYWLDASRNPVLVQISKKHYRNFRNTWNLPANE